MSQINHSIFLCIASSTSGSSSCATLSVSPPAIPCRISDPLHTYPAAPAYHPRHTGIPSVAGYLPVFPPVFQHPLQYIMAEHLVTHGLAEDKIIRYRQFLIAFCHSHSPLLLPQENMLSQKRISIRSMSSPALLLSLGN